MSKNKNPQRTDSAFSRFFRHASKSEREAMFSTVAQNAIDAQNAVQKLSEAIVKAADLTQTLLDDLTNVKAAEELHLLMESFSEPDQITITKQACELLIQRRTEKPAYISMKDMQARYEPKE